MAFLCVNNSSMPRKESNATQAHFLILSEEILPVPNAIILRKIDCVADLASPFSRSITSRKKWLSPWWFELCLPFIHHLLLRLTRPSKKSAYYGWKRHRSVPVTTMADDQDLSDVEWDVGGQKIEHSIPVVAMKFGFSCMVVSQAYYEYRIPVDGQREQQSWRQRHESLSSTFQQGIVQSGGAAEYE
ncbi:hypothetical protein TNCV_923941 [Trichonephila clavipes]|nr:hypothetical protein TNCV_923941 [Trichonephila clavipes]